MPNNNTPLKQDNPTPPIHVKVSHGNLRHAAYPIVVGHYQGDGIVSAEAVLDRSLNQRLSHAHQLGLYPESVNDASIFLQQKKDHKIGCQGAIVIGLEQVGELNLAKLQLSVEQGIICYVHTLIEQYPHNTAPIGGSFLLVGSGSGGILIEDSITAILRGVILANQALKRCYTNTVQLTHIEFIELYLDRSIQAARVLNHIISDEFKDILRIEPLINPIKGGLQRVVYSARDQLKWWQRVQITALNNGTLCFTSLVKRARAEDTILHTQRTVIDNLLKLSTTTTRSKDGLTSTLFELLVPLAFKHHIHTQSDTLLLLDPSSAVYPWEFLQQKNKQPISVQHGLIRQLRQKAYRRSPTPAEGRNILIIGNPLLEAEQQEKLSLLPLPAASAEAFLVSAIFDAQQFSTSLLIDRDASSSAILQALFAKPYRILHLAGHGVYQHSTDKTSPPVTGMVLSDDIFLTPAEIAQMQTVPELVFINCCYLGRMEAESQDKTKGNLQPHRLAANLAQQFIKNGVRCVIAAGWVVDDEAGQHFAESFYTELVNKHIPFGEAVRRARESVYKKFDKLNTWGAYQCYGDPNYRLSINPTAAQDILQPSPNQPTYHYASIQELLSDLENQAAPFPSVVKQIPKQWLLNGHLLATIGRAYGLLKNYPEAIKYYEKSYTVDTTQIRFESIYQLTALTIDWILTLENATQQLPDKHSQALHRVISQLESLINISATAQHYALLGKSYRYLALYSHTNKRIQAINKMYTLYKQACEHPQIHHEPPHIEWVSQWMLSALIKNWRSKKNDLDIPSKLINQIKIRPVDVRTDTNHLENLWARLEFDLICYLATDETNPKISTDTIQPFIAMASYQMTKQLFGIQRIREKLLPTIHFLQEMCKNRRTKSADHVHSKIEALERMILSKMK